MSIQHMCMRPSTRSALIRYTAKFNPGLSIHNQLRLHSLYEPDYLEEHSSTYICLGSLKPKFPPYGALNIQIKGYDFTILENYQKLIHSLADTMDIDVDDGWATPPSHLQIQKFKPQSLVIEAEFKMAVYERNIQITDLPSTSAPILLELLQVTLPEGVDLRTHEHDPEHDEVRYVPDRELIDLKTQLDTLGGPRNPKK